MFDSLQQSLGLSPEVVTYVVLPLFIFFARVCDVTLSTIKILFVMNGNRKIAPLLGFFEAFIWLFAIGQIFGNVNNIAAFFGYAAGFATGTFVGMFIEEKLAVGQVVLRLIAHELNEGLVQFLQENNFGYSIVEGEGRMGKVNVVFLVVKRDVLPKLLEGINRHHPKAFYTIEGVRQVNKSHSFLGPTAPTRGFGGLFSNRR